MDLVGNVKYFFQAIRVPKEIRAEGPDAVRYYNNIEVPEHVGGSRVAVRIYKEAKTLLNTPKAKRSLQLQISAMFTESGSSGRPRMLQCLSDRCRGEGYAVD